MVVLVILILVIYLTFLYRLQIIEGEKYYNQSNEITNTERTVTAARGNILDRYGRIMVSNKECYNLKVDNVKLFANADPNAVILELVHMVEGFGDHYTDDLPVSRTPPFEYDENMTDIQRTMLKAYFVRQKPDGLPENPSAVELLSFMRTRYGIDNSYSSEEMRIIAGVRYSINVRYAVNTAEYLFVEDASMELISSIMENKLVGIEVQRAYIRNYETEYAAHILGYTGLMTQEEYERYSLLSYANDAMVGKDGVEYAFEEYLHGKDGKVSETQNNAGTVLSTVYIEEPEPGAHIYLTIDKVLQEQTERILNNTVNTAGGTNNGKILFTGDGTGRHEIAAVSLANAYCEMDFVNAGRVHLYRGNVWLAGNGNNLNTLYVSNSVLDTLVGDAFLPIYMGRDAGYNGRLIVDEGSVVSNRLGIGHSGRGAVYQRGGEVYWKAESSASTDTFGSYNYGFYGLDAGVCNRTGWMGTGIWSTNSCSFFVQRGGTFNTISGDMIMGAKGYAELYVGGGTNTLKNVTLGSDGDYPQADAATFTVANGAVVSLGRNRLYALHTNGFCAVVNVNSGGKLTCGRINSSGKGSRYGSDFFLNFDGGVLRPSMAWGFTDQWDPSTSDPTRATVYDGGIVMDASDCVTDNAVSRIPFPFQRPYGKGIKAIALPPADSPFWTKNFLGPTRIRISGAGKAATALVDFDLRTAKPKGVIVTGAGFGYDDNTTATVDSWDGKTNYPCTVTLFEHEAKGGFTLRGTLGATLIAANTWGGPTTVESGTLTFTTAAAYPAGSPLVMRPAGAVNFNNVARTLPSITGAGTIGNANVTVTNGLSFYVADASTNAYLHLTGKLTLGSGTTVSVLDHENLVTGGASMVIAKADGGIEGAPTLEGLDNRWLLYVRGNELRFGYAAGTQILLR